MKSESEVDPMSAHQSPPSMGFPRQEYWGRVPLPSPKYVPGIYIYNRLTIANTVGYTGKLLKTVNLKSSHHKE